MTKRPRTRLVSRRNNLLGDGDVEHEVALLQLNLADILLLRFGRRCNVLKVSTMVLIVVRLLVRRSRPAAAQQPPPFKLSIETHTSLEHLLPGNAPASSMDGATQVGASLPGIR